VKSFIQKYEQDVMGSLSGFDRLVFRGLLRRLFYPQGMDYCLAFLGVLLKDFAEYVLKVTARLKEASLAWARHTGRPIQYLASSQVRKDDLAREIAARDRLTDGLICVLTCVEPCQTFEIHRHRESKRLQIRPHRSKCLHLYHYFLHPQFGFMSARLQTWFPLTIQVCLNGREWLARQLTREGIAYQQRGNCFTWIEDPPRAQEIMDRLLRTPWPSCWTRLPGSSIPSTGSCLGTSTCATTGRCIRANGPPTSCLKTPGSWPASIPSFCATASPPLPALT
jgi:hypothetical protein